MSAGTVTQGRRVQDWPTDGGLLDLDVGDYSLDAEGKVWCRLPASTPGGRSYRRLALHEATVHEDGTISVSPSILDPSDGWHGYLERGVWREV